MIYKGPMSQNDEIVTKQYVDNAVAAPFMNTAVEEKIAALEARIAELESAASAGSSPS